MGSLIDLAALILVEATSSDAGRDVKYRMAVVAACAGLAAVSILAAIGCIAASIWISALPSFGRAVAPLIVAASLSALTLTLTFVVWFIMRDRGREPRAAVAPQPLLADASRLFKEDKTAGLLAAIVAGMAAANGGRKS